MKCLVGCCDLNFRMLSFKSAFSLSFSTFIKRIFSSLLSAIRVVSSSYLRVFFCISPNNLDSNLCFIQPGFQHDVLCIEVKYAHWQYGTLAYSFLDLEPVFRSMSSSNCYFLTFPYIFLRRWVRWSGIPTSLKFLTVSCDSHSQSVWHSHKAEVNFFRRQVVFWYPHLFRNFPQFVVIHTKALG